MEQKKQDEDEHVTSAWSQLLPELLSTISLHVFRGGDVGALAVIPSVCKSWNDSLDVNRIAFLIRKSLLDPPLKPLAREYPCLITLKGSLCKFFHPSHVFTMDFPELSGSYIRFSKFGWLLLSKTYYVEDYSSYFFFNPFTRQKIPLPYCMKWFYSMSFSSPPTSSNCFVIGMTWDGRFAITNRGEENWEFYGTFKIAEEYVSCSHLVLCGNRCYAIGDDSNILVFDLKQKVTKSIGTPFPWRSSLVEATYLVENEAELSVVIVFSDEQKVYVSKMNESKRQWMPIEALRNTMLFVSKTSSMLKPAPVKASSNKIYFPKILNNQMYVPYCLDTKKYTSFLRDYISGSPWNVKQWVNCAWIETMPFVTPASHQQFDW
ncbi:F-box family protein [Euphorbia peplus]|nr:F-box family protein [Euphorbia peplus]